MKTPSVSTCIHALTGYAVRHHLIEETDRTWATNQLLSALALDTCEAPPEDLPELFAAAAASCC